MKVLRRFLRRLSGTVLGQRDDGRIREELAEHHTLLAEEFVRAGFPLDEAQRRARLKLGATEATVEAYRDERALPVMDALTRDVRHSIRMFKHEPGLHLSVVLVLAGTIGLCTVVFGAADAILLRPLPYRDANRLVRVHETTPAGQRFAVSAATLFAWQQSIEEFQDVMAFRARTFEWQGPAVAERIQGAMVSASFLEVLGVQPFLGRVFVQGEDEAGRSNVVLVSHGFWTRHFGADANTLGQDIRLGPATYRLVGVLPPGFELPVARSEFSGELVDVFVPIDWTPDARADRDNRTWRVIARLRDRASIAQAQAATTALMSRLTEDDLSPQRWGALVEPLRDSMFGKTTQVFWLLLAGVGGLLLLGCSNVATLLLARGVVRQQEFAVRAAVGAGAARLRWQVLVEGCLLGLTGATVGLLFARAGLRLFQNVAPTDLPRVEQVSMNGAVVAVTYGLAIAATILFSALPAWQAASAASVGSLRSRGVLGNQLRARIQTALLVVQIALTVTLLAGATLLARSVVALQSTELGLDATNVMTFRLVLDTTRYPRQGERWTALHSMLQRVGEMPGVQSVAAVSHPPMVWGDSFLGFAMDGSAPVASDEMPSALHYSITPDYFGAMGIPMVAGRAFTERDSADRPRVVIVNEHLARKYLSSRDPIGARLRLTGIPDTAEIVGVVGDTKHYGPDSAPREQVYLPYAQYPSSTTTVVVKGRQPVEVVAPGLRHAIAEIDPRQAVSNVVSMDDAVKAKIAPQRLSAALLATFAGLALLLATAGTFALFAYDVRQRRAELSLRLVLGAQPRQVGMLVMARALRVAAMGVLVGIILAWTTGGLLQTLLFGVAPTDAATLVAVPVLMLAAVLAASVGPARVASRVDPARVFRLN